MKMNPLRSRFGRRAIAGLIACGIFLPLMLASAQNDGLATPTVTKILPLKFGNAAKLVESLRPLLSDSAQLTPNGASDAIVISDTQTNVHRVETIVSALDTPAVSSSTIRVFKLNSADARAVVDLITQLFVPAGQHWPFGSKATSTTAQSEAGKAEGRVFAVEGIKSNSVVVSAPEDTITEIRSVIKELDVSPNKIFVTHVFKLTRAASLDTARIINQCYSNGQATDTTADRTQSEQNRPRNSQSKNIAVGDPQKNFLLATAPADTMAKITTMVRLMEHRQEELSK